MDRSTSNQDQSDHRPIVGLHISSNTFHQRKRFVFCDICHIPFVYRLLERRRMFVDLTTYTSEWWSSL